MPEMFLIDSFLGLNTEDDQVVLPPGYAEYMENVDLRSTRGILQGERAHVSLYTTGFFSNIGYQWQEWVEEVCVPVEITVQPESIIPIPEVSEWGYAEGRLRWVAPFTACSGTFELNSHTYTFVDVVENPYDVLKSELAQPAQIRLAINNNETEVIAFGNYGNIDMMAVNPGAAGNLITLSEAALSLEADGDGFFTGGSDEIHPEVSFSVTVTGTEPFTYEWQRDVTEVGWRPVDWGTFDEATWTFEFWQGCPLGPYRCVITNACGEATTEEVWFGDGD